MNVCGVIAVAVGFLVLPGPSCSNSDNMALLLGTLKMMQRASCDEDVVSLACPTATTISIQVARYGKASGNNDICAAVELVDDEDCLWPNTMQYSLLQTVVEACQKKPECKFSTKPRPGIEEPCSHTRKFVDVRYKCRPHEFRSRTCCQDDVIKLSCNPHSRVAIFDAFYGRAYGYEPITCHQSGINNKTCTSPRALDTLMQICHGKRKCHIEASERIFGSPCEPTTRPYLKVVYACVPLGVLKERYESKLEDDERPNGRGILNNDNDNFFDESEGAGEKWGEPNTNPALQLPGEIFDTTPYKPTETTPRPRRIAEDTDSQTQFKQKIFIYIGIGVVIFIIIVAILLGIRYYMIRKQAENSKNGDMFTTEPPNVFSDGVSDIDNDIDVSHISGTFYDPVHPDMILYRESSGNKGTIRAMRPLSTIYPSGVSMYGNDYVPPPLREMRPMKEEEVERVMSPKSLGTYSNSQFYYG